MLLKCLLEAGEEPEKRQQKLFSGFVIGMPLIFGKELF